MKTLARRILQFPVTRIVIAFLAVVIATILVQFGMTWLGQPLGIGTAGWYEVLSSVLVVVVVYVVYRLYVRVIEKRAATELDMRGALQELGAGILFGAVLFTIVIGGLWLLGVYRVLGWNAALDLAPILAASIFAGFVEEVLFRGILFRIVQESLGTWLALAISGLFFGFAHAANPGATLFSSVAIALEAGLLLGAAYMLTQRLWFAVGIHFAWNMTQGGVFGVAISGNSVQGLLSSELVGPELVSGGAFGAEASVVALVVCLGAFGLLYWQAQKRGHIVLPFWVR
ncbi:MAG: CPBP family intramembrane metalloprotease [Chloroflexi bacterium]|nr:CPBP family intramembrane metalloprotease [Chloroflexota bacterium]